MRLLKYCRSKKVIAVVLATLIAFSTVVFGKVKTDIKSVETQKIEMTNQNRDVINVKRNMGASEIITINNKTYKAKRMNVKATAFSSAKDEGGAYAWNGEKLKDGHIAVDFNVIPMNTMVYIPQLGKIYKAVDTGSKIKGAKIDIWMPTKQQCKSWGIKDLEIWILE